MVGLQPPTGCPGGGHRISASLVLRARAHPQGSPAQRTAACLQRTLSRNHRFGSSQASWTELSESSLWRLNGEPDRVGDRTCVATDEVWLHVAWSWIWQHGRSPAVCYRPAPDLVSASSIEWRASANSADCVRQSEIKLRLSMIAELMLHRPV